MLLSNELLDKLLSECNDPQKDQLSKDGLVKQSAKRLIEQALEGNINSRKNQRGRGGS